MRRTSDCIGCEAGSTMLVIGAGGTLREYEEPIKDFISDSRPVTIGINYMTNFCIPDYHLWTNKQRYLDFGDCIDKSSKMMFGCGLPKKLIRKHFKGDYILVDYDYKIKGADTGVPVRYEDGKICGYFRTAGSLAIVIAHLFGTSWKFLITQNMHTLCHQKTKTPWQMLC